ncbi:MAG: hypothetical protein J2P38_03920 [Candidatus Dormibacteraeota bacterium]|nr:hypothetical protein [Candidatus Dormibacteraeota bacterium]
MSRAKRLVIGAALLFMSFLLLGSGGGVNRGASAPWGQHTVAAAADVNAIMATGGCKAGTMVMTPDRR